MFENLDGIYMVFVFHPKAGIEYLNVYLPFRSVKSDGWSGPKCLTVLKVNTTRHITLSLSTVNAIMIVSGHFLKRNN